MGKCKNGRCDCEKFHSHFSCSCGYKWEYHTTIFESAAERRKTGRDTENLCGANPIFAASSGAITNFSSLIPGAERKKYDPASLYYREVQGGEELQVPSVMDKEAIWMHSNPPGEQKIETREEESYDYNCSAGIEDDGSCDVIVKAVRCKRKTLNSDDFVTLEENMKALEQEFQELSRNKSM